jgi:hypothetical protein
MGLKRPNSKDKLLPRDSPSALEPPSKKQNNGPSSGHEGDKFFPEQQNPPMDSFRIKDNRLTHPLTPDIPEPPLTHWLGEGEECEVPMSHL